MIILNNQQQIVVQINASYSAQSFLVDTLHWLLLVWLEVCQGVIADRIAGRTSASSMFFDEFALYFSRKQKPKIFSLSGMTQN